MSRRSNALWPRGNEFLIYEKDADEETEEKKKKNDWYRYAPENVVGPHVFNTGVEISNELMASSRVQAAIDHYRKLHPKTHRWEVEQKIKDILNTLGADFGEGSVRWMAWGVGKILQQLYNGIHISESEFNTIKHTAQQCFDRNIPLILCPTHKSHMDYLVISYVFFMCDISLPFIAAGDNLNMPIVGRLLRNSGAFFIKRDAPKNHPDHTILYRAVFDEYIQIILSRGFSLEFFLEGGRSRTGKLLRPKRGLLSQVVRSVTEGRTTDAYIVPLSIAYDKVIETESYVQELLGTPKKKESLGGLISSSKILSLSFGRIDFRVSEPFSLKEWLTSASLSRNLSLTNPNHIGQLVKTLSYTILFKINCVSVAMPTAIVAAAFLTHRGRGLPFGALEKRYEWIVEMIKDRGGKIAAVPETITTTQIVEASVGVLGKMLERHNDILETIYTPIRTVELSFYRNQIIHWFLQDGIICCCMNAHLRPLRSLQPVGFAALLKDVKTLSLLFKTEFIYEPTGNIEQNFSKSLDRLLKRGVLTQFEGDASRLIPADSGRERREYEFLCALFWPFIDAYWLMAASFYSLLPNKIVDEKPFLQKVQKFGLNLYHQGELSFYEALSGEYLKDSFDSYLSDGIVTRHREDQPLIQLGIKYQQEKELVSMIEDIGRFRCESKYAKDPDENFPPRVKKLANLLHAQSKL